MEVGRADEILETIESGIDHLKEAQKKRIEELKKEDTSRYSKRAQKKQDAYEKMLSDAAGFDFNDDKDDMKMTQEDLEKAMIGAAADIQPNVPLTPKQLRNR